MNLQTTALLASMGLLVRWGVSLWPHSGQSSPPMFGDFEAQRHWMEVTTNLPLEDWYSQTPSNDLQYWGLDYPPLTAYHSWTLGKISEKVNSSWTALGSSRGLESGEHKLFMRLTVMVTDLVVLFPAIQLTSLGRPEALACLLTYPGLILIDHGHFQYNSASLGLFLLAVAAILRGRDCLASLLFVLALNYKQMELYHALPFFCYLLGLSLHQPSALAKLGKLARIGVTVLATFALVWAPFILLGQDSVLQVLNRCFPFNRGLFEDKVANFWCSLDVLVKLRSLMTIPELAQLSAGTTLLLCLPSNLHLLLRPSIRTFLLSLVNTALVFFMFSFQVHEKSILLAALPMCLLYSQDLPPSLATLLPWALTLTTFSMLPLLIKDGLLLPSLAMVVMHLTLLKNLPDFLPSILESPRRSQSPIPTLPSTTSEMLFRAMCCLSLLGCSILTVLSVTVPPPARLPYLWSLAVSSYSAAHFLLFLGYFHFLQFTTSSMDPIMKPSSLDPGLMAKKTQ